MTGEASPFIGEILDSAFQQAQAVVVLLNGDDEARLRPEYYSENMPDYEKNLTPQARPNVLFEAGLALGRFPKRTIIVEVGELRPFSDIAGRHTIRLNNSTKTRQDVAQRLMSTGCKVDLSGTDWHTTGNFVHNVQLELKSNEINSSVVSQLSQTHLKILELLIKNSSTLVGISKNLEISQRVILPLLQDLIDQGLIATSAMDIKIAHFALKETAVRYLTSLGKL